MQKEMTQVVISLFQQPLVVNAKLDISQMIGLSGFVNHQHCNSAGKPK